MPTPPPASLSSNGTDWIGPICTERLENNRGLSSSWICNISEWRSSIKSDQPPQLAVKLLKFTSNFKGVELKGWKPHWCAFVVTCQCYLCYLRVPRVGGHCQLLDALICASETVLAAIRVTWLPSGGPGVGWEGLTLQRIQSVEQPWQTGSYQLGCAHFCFSLLPSFISFFFSWDAPIPVSVLLKCVSILRH